MTHAANAWHMPKLLNPLAYPRMTRNVMGRFTDRAYQILHGEPPIPPHRLRRHVMQNPTRANFSRRGLRMLGDLEHVLTRINRPFDSFRAILDMASGAGCTMRWLVKRFPTARLYAADNHAPSIDWLKKNFRSPHITLNQTLPPLPYQADTVELTFAMSLFSHLSEPHHKAWLAELSRVTSPNGVVVLTTHGPIAIEKFLPIRRDVADRETVAKKGIVFFPYDAREHYGMTYMSDDYVRSVWSQWFDVLGHFPGQLDQLQDMWVLRPKR